VPEPLTAELADLERCLRSLGKRPLKLIADSVVPEFGEIPWDTSAWRCGSSGKMVLAHPEDSFQFSLGGPESKQDYHRHDHVYEIYVSYSPMTVRFEGGERRVESGVLVIPPGVAHQVTLTGTTFVFQAATSGAQVHADRVSLAMPGAT
jgi:hypothetical protein